jgi:DNA-directed RNA polymerase specialized sigma24 family protein
VGGDPPRAAFAELYSSHRDRLIRLAHVLTGSQVAAEDIVQDTFVRVGPRLDDLNEPSAYLRRVKSATHRARRDLRRILE